MFSNLYRLDMHKKTCVAIANLWWSISKTQVSWFSYAYWKRMFVDSLTEYFGPPNCVQYWVWSRIWRRSPDCFFMVFVLWSSPDHTPIKYRCLIKTSNWITPSYLRGCRYNGFTPFIRSRHKTPGMDGRISSKLLIFDGFASNYQPESPLYCSSFLSWSSLVLHPENINRYNQS